MIKDLAKPSAKVLETIEKYVNGVHKIAAELNGLDDDLQSVAWLSIVSAIEGKTDDDIKCAINMYHTLQKQKNEAGKNEVWNVQFSARYSFDDDAGK
jgi:hypothetical protein